MLTYFFCFCDLSGRCSGLLAGHLALGGLRRLRDPRQTTEAKEFYSKSLYVADACIGSETAF